MSGDNIDDLGPDHGEGSSHEMKEHRVCVEHERPYDCSGISKLAHKKCVHRTRVNTCDICTQVKNEEIDHLFNSLNQLENDLDEVLETKRSEVDNLLAKKTLKKIKGKQPWEKGITLKKGITGLENTGNGCWMNSIVQCLVHTRPLMKYMMRWSNDMKTEMTSKDGEVALELCALLTRLYSSRKKAFSPEKLRARLGETFKDYEKRHQEDCEEFLTRMMNILQENLKDCFINSRNDSLIADVFEGECISQLKCQRCKYVWSEQRTNVRQIRLHLTSMAEQESLLSCLHSFLNEENLAYSDRHCHHCGELTKTTGQTKMLRWPEIIIIHFLRFKQATRSGYYKNQTVIDFPPNLDLSKYVADTNGTSNDYALYAIVNHIGNSINDGHYTSDIMVDGNWFNFDDSKVNPTEQTKFDKTQAYLLFYKRSTPQQEVDEFKMDNYEMQNSLAALADDMSAFAMLL